MIIQEEKVKAVELNYQTLEKVVIPIEYINMVYFKEVTESIKTVARGLMEGIRESTYTKIEVNTEEISPKDKDYIFRKSELYTTDRDLGKILREKDTLISVSLVKGCGETFQEVYVPYKVPEEAKENKTLTSNKEFKTEDIYKEYGEEDSEVIGVKIQVGKSE